MMNGTQRGSPLPATLERYRETLLDQEYLVAGRVDLPHDKRALDQLRLSEGHSVFILNEDVSEQKPEAGSPSVRSEASIEEYFSALPALHSVFGQIPKRYLENLILQTEATLLASNADLRNSTLLGHSVTTTGEWLLDNHYLFEVNAAEVKAHLPKRYGWNVPGLQSASSMPRIYAIARELACHLNFSVDAEAMVRALQAYQQHST